MVEVVKAYRTSNGKVFVTPEEAEAHEIKIAAEVLANKSIEYFQKIGLGHGERSVLAPGYDAIVRLADAIKARPVPAEPEVKRGT